MRSFLLPTLFFLLVMVAIGCRYDGNAIAIVQPARLTVIQDSIQGVLFDQDILPILKAKCSPCHFEGGKMYQRMPFDNSETIKAHPEGVIKRFKEPDLAKIKVYLGKTKE